MSPGQPGAPPRVAQLALFSLASFLVGAVLLWLLVAKVELLVRFGFAGRLYYIVLLPLGLAVSGFLFGVLNSVASYRSKAFGGALKIGGPVFAFVLVVLGGFLLAPDPQPFSLTVFVHGEGGLQDIPLRNAGFVLLDLGPDRRREAIGAKGEATFSGIPAGFRGQDVPIVLEAEGFEPVRANAWQPLDEASLYLAVRRKALALRGRVQDLDGRAIAGAGVTLLQLSTTSDAAGFFTLKIPRDLVQENLSLSVSAPGHAPWREAVTPGSNEVVVILRKEQP